MCSEIHLERFSAREVARGSSFEHFPWFWNFSKKPRSSFAWYLLYFRPGRPSLFISVVWADSKSCTLTNDADSWWYCVEISVVRLRRGQIRFLNPAWFYSILSCVPFVPGLLFSPSVAEFLPSTVWANLADLAGNTVSTMRKCEKLNKSEEMLEKGAWDTSGCEALSKWFS